jgi:alpha-ketoglutarate-dependent taurine dioxygenase
MATAIDISPLGDAVDQRIHDDPFLLIATPRDPALANDPNVAAGWFRDQAEAIERALVKHGTILLRGFAFTSSHAFDEALQDYASLPGGYAGGASPRAAILGRVYEATSAASDIPIVPHQEMSYLPRWPRKVAFYCHHAPDVGGETTTAHVPRFEETMDRRFYDAVAERGLIYRRNYRDRDRSEDFPASLDSVHRSWQDSFYSDDPARAEAVIADMGMEHRWEGDGSITAVYRSEGFTTHPLTGGRHWFNQLQTLYFTPQNLPSRWDDYVAYYADGRPKPYDICHGDDVEIALDDVIALLPPLEAATVALPWQKGDVMVLDNILAMHGRNPFTGPRDIQVALLESGGV